MPSRLDINYIREVAQLRGGKCLSKEYIDYNSPLKWMCEKGHTWETGYDIIQQGGWCVQCITGQKRKLSLEEMQVLAHSHKGKCLSKEYLGSNVKLKWQCSKGHIWEAVPTSIKSVRSWCPVCAGVAKPTITDIQLLARKKGIKCLSEKYTNNHQKLNWQCSKGHEWMTTLKVIKKGFGCPHCSHCAKLTISEMKAIAVKHKGKCLSSEYLTNRAKLKWQCKEGHIWEAVPHNIKQGQWCPFCAGTMKQSIQDMQDIAKQRGGKCLSQKYIHANSKLKWQCKEGHVWMAKPGKIKFGSWCPFCAQTVKLTIGKMKLLAKQHNGKCLSTKYIDNKTKLKWQCVNGHKWMAAPGTIISGHWCKQCFLQRNKLEKI